MSSWRRDCAWVDLLGLLRLRCDQLPTFRAFTTRSGKTPCRSNCYLEVDQVKCPSKSKEHKYGPYDGENIGHLRYRPFLSRFHWAPRGLGSSIQALGLGVRSRVILMS